MTNGFAYKAVNSARHFTPAPTTPAQERLWTETRGRLVASCPAFSHILYSMMGQYTGKQLAIFTKDVPIAATDGVNLILNPDTFFALSLPERTFVVAHEIMHCVLGHMEQLHHFRRRGSIGYPDGKKLEVIPELLNVATDLVINDLLIESKVGVFLKGGLHDKSVATYKDNALDVYRKLYEQAEKSGGAKGGQGNTQVKGQGFDEHLQPGAGQGKNPDQAAQERNEGEWKTQIAAGVAAAKAQGRLPAGLDQFFSDMLNPSVDWREHIKALFARKVGSGGFDWRRPDRRLLTRSGELGDPVYAPGRSGHGVGTVVVGVDTSGSIGGKILDVFFAELSGILEDLRPKRLVIMWCDAKCHRVDEAEEASDLNVIRAKGAPGGGGTSFVPVFDEMAAMGLAPDALVYITDGWGSFPNAAPSYPVIWGSIDAKAEHYPFGDVVMVPAAA